MCRFAKSKDRGHQLIYLIHLRPRALIKSEPKAETGNIVRTISME